MLARRTLLAAAALPFAGPGMQAIAADSFVESVGVNVHLGSEPYLSRFELVRERLAALGVRHLRDELRPGNDVDRWRILFERHGIRSHWLVSPATNTPAEMLAYLKALGPEKVSAIEGQNEGDSDWFMAQPQARPHWDRAVIAYQRAIHTALRPRYPRMPLLSPSVIDYKPADAALLRGAAPYCDIVAIHPYVQRAQEPETTDEYAGIDWYLRHFRDAFKPGAPVMATEAGYTTLDRPGGVTEDAAATYLPRMLLHLLTSGVRRSFIYQLMDEGTDPGESEHHYGLLREDGAPKPAFGTLRTLMQVLADPGPRFAPGRLPLEIAGECRRMLFQRRDRSCVLALWQPWPWGRQQPVPVGLRLGGATGSVLARRLTEADWSTLGPVSDRMTVPVSGDVTLLRWSA